MPSRVKKYRWIILGGLALLLRVPLSLFPEFTEDYYQNGLFAIYRVLWDHSAALLPFPLLYLAIVLLLIWVIWLIRRPWSIGHSPKWLVLLNGAGFLVFWFYVLWGYNYHTPTMSTRLDLNAQKASIEELQPFAEWLINEMESQREAALIGPWVEIEDAHMLDSLRENLETVLEPLHYPTSGKVNCRLISESGFMRRLGILGIYLPFVGEGHVDKSVTDLSLYFSAVHEMSHGYGITNEGEANFAAWLALTHTDLPVCNYLGNLELFRYVLYDLYSMDYDLAEQVKSRLPLDIANDLSLIRANSKAYPGYFPEFSTAMNNIYLKTQGVEEGVASYSEFVELAMAYSTTTR